MSVRNRQAINEAARPLRILKLNTIPNPCEHDGGGFGKTSGDVDELRTAGCARIATSKPSLVVEWFMAGCAIEKLVEARQVHRSPPSIISFSRCLTLNRMRSPQSRQRGTRPCVVSRRSFIVLSERLVNCEHENHGLQHYSSDADLPPNSWTV
jgi:hypothetical protein